MPAPIFTLMMWLVLPVRDSGQGRPCEAEFRGFMFASWVRNLFKYLETVADFFVK